MNRMKTLLIFLLFFSFISCDPNYTVRFKSNSTIKVIIAKRSHLFTLTVHDSNF